ncbi:MAG TPA: pyridoxal-phosphate dependent enzyme [Candidatus Angelobacter sp.]
MADIRGAVSVLRRYLSPSRLLLADSLTKRVGHPVYLKIESDLPTASFKVRGAIVALADRLSRSEVTEVVCSSTGNHGAAVAYAARQFGVRATVFVPQNPNPIKRARIESLGAVIREGGRDLSDAIQAGCDYAAKKGAYFLSDATDKVLPAGPATIAVEILDQQPQTQAIYVPVGDTALIRGIASATKLLQPQIRIIGVQAEAAPSYYLSWKQRRPIETPDCQTIADGLATRTPQGPNVDDIVNLVDDFRLVSEKGLQEAIKHLLLREHLLAEPAGAATTAALLNDGTAQGLTVLILSGANISEDVLRLSLCH